MSPLMQTGREELPPEVKNKDRSISLEEASFEENCNRNNNFKIIVKHCIDLQDSFLQGHNHLLWPSLLWPSWPSTTFYYVFRIQQKSAISLLENSHSYCAHTHDLVANQNNLNQY